MTLHRITHRATCTIRRLPSVLRNSLFSKEITPALLIIYVAVFIGLFNNTSFYGQVWPIYPFTIENLPFIVSLSLVLMLFTALMISLLAVGPMLKPVLVATLLISANTGYFMDTYHIIIDDVMLDNMLRTDRAEVFAHWHQAQHVQDRWWALKQKRQFLWSLP